MAGQNLTPVDTAIEQILAQAPVLSRTETVALTDSLDRVLGENIYVPADVPPADNSACPGCSLIQISPSSVRRRSTAAKTASSANSPTSKLPLPKLGALRTGSAPSGLVFLYTQKPTAGDDTSTRICSPSLAFRSMAQPESPACTHNSPKSFTSRAVPLNTIPTGNFVRTAPSKPAHARIGRAHLQ